MLVFARFVRSISQGHYQQIFERNAYLPIVQKCAIGRTRRFFPCRRRPGLGYFAPKLFQRDWRWLCLEHGRHWVFDGAWQCFSTSFGARYYLRFFASRQISVMPLDVVVISDAFCDLNLSVS